MKKSIAATFLVAFSSFVTTTRVKTCGFITVVLLAGCTTTQVRWDAIGVREQVMKYYNDEIMDNLIRMKEGLPFVHVDISSVSAAAASQLTGSVGAGETRSSTRPGPLGVLGTVSRAVMRPFAYSVTPLRSDTLTITSVPVIGQLPADTQATASELVKTKVTEMREPPEKPAKQTVTELTPKPSTTTIYDLYDSYGKSLVENPKALVYSEGLIPPNGKKYLPGTLKRHGSGYYYIQKDYKEQYRLLCMSLFKQSRGKPSTKTLTPDVEVLRAQGTLIPPTPRSP